MHLLAQGTILLGVLGRDFSGPVPFRLHNKLMYCVTFRDRVETMDGINAFGDQSFIFLGVVNAY